jgi:DNA-binding response OmpR family regulator
VTRTEILLVESNADERGRLESILSGWGYGVRAADSLASAKELADETASDLLLVGLLQQDGTAFDFAKRWTDDGGVALGVAVYRGPTAKQYLTERTGVQAILAYPADESELAAQVHALFPQTSEVAVVEAPSAPEPPAAARLYVPRRLDATTLQNSGTLEKGDLAAVISRLASNLASGALMLQCEQTKKLIYFEQGVAVGIKSNIVQEYLGQMLVGEGVISAQDCLRSLREMKRSKRRQGEVLVALGCLDQAGLDAAMWRQFLFKFQEIFSWTQGAYRYRDSAVPQAYAAQALDQPANLLWNGIQQARPTERVREVLAPVMDHTVHWTGSGLDVTGLQVAPEASSIWDVIGTPATAGEVVSGARDPELALLLLYALTAFGTVSYETPSFDTEM